MISNFDEDYTEPRMNATRSSFFPIVGFVVIGVFLFFLILGGCVNQHVSDGPPKKDIDVSQIKNPVPHYLPKSRYGNPDFYAVHGKTYRVLKTAKHYNKKGIASWYGTKFQGKLTSTHEPYDLYAMTAASPELPIPCFVRVTNLNNGKQIIVKVNDRGPFAPNRILDLSYAAAKKLGYMQRGTALVQVSSIDVENPLHKTMQTFAHHAPQLYLQAGAYKLLDNAQLRKLQLEEIIHLPIRISHGTEFYRVQIGPIKNVELTDQLQRKIASAGLGEAITVIS